MSESTNSKCALSAYLDSELSMAELAEIEQLVANDELAREELDELREVSQVMRELPKRRAPMEFGPSVMARIESEMLLPKPRANSQCQASVPAKNWSTIGLSTVALIALVAVIASLPLAGPEGEDASVAETSSAIKKTDQVVTKSTDTAGLPTEAKVEIPRNVAVGDLIRICESSDGRVAVVELTVIDVEKSIDRLEVLLMDGSGQTKHKTIGDAPSSKPAATNDGLFALYVERDRSELSTALGEFLGDEGLAVLEADLASASDVDVAAIDDSEAKVVELLEEALRMTRTSSTESHSPGTATVMSPEELPLRVMAHKRNRPGSPALPESPLIAAHTPEIDGGESHPLLSKRNSLRVLFVFQHAIGDAKP